MSDNNTYRLVILGMTNSGKTYLTRKIVAAESANEERYPIFIVDPHHDFTYGTRVKTTEQTIQVLNDRYHKAGSPIILSVDSDIKTAEITYNTFFELCYKIGGILVVDEVDMHSRKMYLNPNLLRINDYGRHAANNRGISLITNCRRAADIHNRLLAQATQILCFRQTLPSDLDALEKFGIDREKVSSQKLGEWLCLKENTPDFEKLLTFWDLHQ